jgi:hypothetical protein
VQRYLPSLVYPDPAEHRVAMVWGGVVALLLLLDRLARDRDGVDRAFRGLGLPLLLLVLLGVLVDSWARAGPAAPPRAEPVSAEEP